MVEFGLKLQDNKVEEWSNKYIDYEKLKQLLQIAKKASKARDSLENQTQGIAFNSLIPTYENEKKTKSGSVRSALSDTLIVDHTPEIDGKVEDSKQWGGSIFSCSENIGEEELPLLNHDDSNQIKKGNKSLINLTNGCSSTVAYFQNLDK